LVGEIRWDAMECRFLGNRGIWIFHLSIPDFAYIIVCIFYEYKGGKIW
jgi:hypothetical protein